jgi:hypothetical protein
MSFESEAVSGDGPITPPAQRRTGRFLTKFEIARVVGTRAKEIAEGHHYNVDTARQSKRQRHSTGSQWHGSSLAPPTPDSMMATMATGAADVPPLSEFRTALAASDPIRLAKNELVHKRIPYIIRRTFPDGVHVENIPLVELEIDRALLKLI